MKIRIIGGGPAGLYFAILMKRIDRSHDIEIVERDGPHDTFGWGIVFSDQTFAYLAESDEPAFRRLVASCVTWDNVDIVRGDSRIDIRGNRFSGIARLAFLNILQARCAELGVNIRFKTVVGEHDPLPDADLLVGADGANSIVRARFAGAFQPVLAQGRNKYVWLGTSRLFHGLTLTFRDSPNGLFTAHSYNFDGVHSTFIVECSEATWNAAGFARMSGAETCAHLERVFAGDLAGHPLLTSNYVRWINFLLVKNARWRAERLVLLGDALHTAHFSIGSGTKLALEDAIALADGFSRHTDVGDALADFETTRRPIVDALQEAARDSQIWFENVAALMSMAPVPFAYALMTRSGKIDRERLRRRDPAFVAQYEAWMKETGKS